MSTGFIEGCLNELDRFMSIEDYLSPESPRLLCGAVAAGMFRSRGSTRGDRGTYEKSAEVEEIAQVYESKEFLSLGDRTRKLGGTHVRRVAAHIERKDIMLLESILKEHYNDKTIIITSIDDLPATRKQAVKRVYYQREGRYHGQVWLVKANPNTMTQELTVYYVAHENGFPTAMPIGFDPKKEVKYNHRIAVLGGVLEHAGDPYSRFIETLKFTPSIMNNTGKIIAAHIADMHGVLTRNKELLKMFGVKLEKHDPGKELNERLFAAVEVKDQYKTALINSSRELYDLQSGGQVVLEGDMHLGQVVTITNNQGEIDNTKYGIIDFGSVCIGHPLGDLISFDIHLRRKGRELCSNKWEEGGELVESYSKNSRYNKSDLENPINRRIHEALWHSYELFDPARKNPEDIQAKAKYHMSELVPILYQLKKITSVGPAANRVKEALRDMAEHTKDMNYLACIQ